MAGQLERLPELLEKALALEPEIKAMAHELSGRHHALFLGRGQHYPIAQEAALKLKEISYIHAEAYAAGELKHGPLALVDEDMPVVAVCPNDALLEKLVSNIEEVRARGGKLLLFNGWRDMALTPLGTIPVASTTRSTLLLTSSSRIWSLNFTSGPLAPATTSLTWPLVKVMPFFWPLR